MEILLPPYKVMEYEDQWCLGLFLLELKRHKEKLLDENIKTISNHQYRTIMTFFSSISPHAATQSRCHTSGVLIRILQRGYNRSSITMCNAHGPWPSGWRPYHPFHHQIKIIITWFWRCFPCLRVLSLWSGPCWRFFEGWSFRLSNTWILSAYVIRFFSTLCLIIFILVCFQNWDNIWRCFNLIGLLALK